MTSKKIKCANYRVKFKEKFDVKALYYLMHEWLVQEEWASRNDKNFKEIFAGYSEAASNGGEAWWSWRPEKIKNNYFKWQMSINAHLILLKKVEVIKDGEKFKTDSGEVEVLIDSWIETDYQGTWKTHSILKHFEKIYRERIMKENIEKQRKELKNETYRLQEAIKDYLQIRAIEKESESQGDFFPRKGMGE